MEIDISSGGWQWRASVFDSGDGRRWALVFHGGNGRQLWQRWMIETVFNGNGHGGGDVQWQQQHLTAFNGMGDGLQREDKRVAQGQATQQLASTLRGREGAVQREDDER
jgi:hypothetical protein